MMVKAISRITIAVILALLAAILAPTGAEAHAVLLESSPPAKAEVLGDKVEFSLHYNSRVDALRSRLTLKGPDGSKPLAARQGKTEADLAARAEGLTTGHYTLKWDVLSVDGHVSRGEVPFIIIER